MVAPVLVVGGGYDTLCLRLAAEFPDVAFVELDHPPTHQSKAKAVEAMGATRPNLHLRGVDLSERSLAEVLAEAPFWSPGAKSVAIAEGVLMYLSEDEVVAFLTAVRESTATGSRVLATYVFDGSLGRESLGWLGSLLSGLLKLVGEPFKWGVDGNGIEGFLAARGFRVLGES